MFDIPTPDGSLVDLAHVHLLTSTTLEECAVRWPDLDWDVRRFRPTQPRLYHALNQPDPARPNHLGVYATVTKPGDINLDDPVESIPEGA